ncbi:MAG: hypothetical protein SPH11_06190, partial [Lentihominibacter sp.]|uniref:hypothetical protein n=1 Tax=Lentihominibacter sp. TaxID=2944216 RepID=UPI002A91891A
VVYEIFHVIPLFPFLLAYPDLEIKKTHICFAVIKSIHESHSLRFARFLKTEIVDKSHLRANYSPMEFS